MLHKRLWKKRHDDVVWWCELQDSDYVRHHHRYVHDCDEHQLGYGRHRTLTRHNHLGWRWRRRRLNHDPLRAHRQPRGLQLDGAPSSRLPYRIEGEIAKGRKRRWAQDERFGSWVPEPTH
jgi:hypothetical protein